MPSAIPGVVESWRVQVFAFGSALALLAFLAWLIKRRHLKEEYSLLWVGTSVLIMALALWRGSLDRLASLLGIYYPPAALFLVLLGGMLLILLHFSIALSAQKEQIRGLAQEVALLRERIEGPAAPENGGGQKG